MIRLFLCLAILICSAQTYGQTPSILELNPGTTNYQGGDRLVLISSIRTTPTAPNSEVVVKASLDGVPVKVVKLSETEFGAVSPDGKSPGLYNWVSKAYIQDRDFVRNLELSIIKLEQENQHLEALIQGETDSSKVILLQQAIVENENRIDEAYGAIDSHRYLIDESSLDVNVNYFFAASVVDPTMEIFTDKTDNSFVFGEPVTAYFKIKEGTGGPIKTSLTSSINWDPTYAQKLDHLNYKLEVEQRRIGIGVLFVSGSFEYRNYFASESLLDGYAQATSRIGLMNTLKNSSFDPALASYYQREIDDLTLIRTALMSIYDSSVRYGESVSLPILILPPLSKFYKVSAGAVFTCGIYSSTAYCWGHNGYGQIGQGDNTNRNTPSQVYSLSDSVSDISAGEQHACAIRIGTVFCWGRGDSGQLGNGSLSNRTTPSFVSLSYADSVSAGANHTCAKVSGYGYCWGANAVGQLGNGGLVNSSTPIQISLQNIKDIKVGRMFSCALVESGQVYCWGDNSKGQLGNNSTATYSSTPVLVQGLSNVDRISAGHEVACAISVGKTYCWGSNGYGQLGAGFVGTLSRIPVAVSGVQSGSQEIAVGIETVCAVVSGAAKCWGHASGGALGNGATSGTSATPVQVAGLTSNVKAISNFNKFACAIQGDQLKCWGTNYGGNIGNGTGSGSNALIPVTVNPL
ncbi:RCC1 domain-containing protein [Bdellovibrio bacteriovorus]|uniref:RCC1 domain-containing protein n=1 Tax=Bdellovibrio bacteriovorus TaxID=959 RepID=UPI003A7F8120